MLAQKNNLYAKLSQMSLAWKTISSNVHLPKSTSNLIIFLILLILIPLACLVLIMIMLHVILF